MARKVKKIQIFELINIQSIFYNIFPKNVGVKISRDKA